MCQEPGRSIRGDRSQIRLFDLPQRVAEVAKASVEVRRAAGCGSSGMTKPLRFGVGIFVVEPKRKGNTKKRSGKGREQRKGKGNGRGKKKR